MLTKEVLMNKVFVDNAVIQKLTKLRDIAILKKDHMQFGLTSLLVSLRYGTEFEANKSKEEELVLK